MFKIHLFLKTVPLNSAARQGHIGAKTALVGDADTEALDPTEQAITRSFKLMIGAASPDV